MKAYIDQIFYEGLGKSLYCPVESKIKKLSNKELQPKLINIFKVIYFIFSIAIAVSLWYFY